jgi:hypothetical protein
MNDKLIVIIATGDVTKARTGLMYAVNTYKNEWMSDVEIFIFGPAQKLLISDQEVLSYIYEFNALDKNIIACKAVADQDEITQQIADKNVKIDYVGKPISDYIKQGYIPMVW